MRNWLARRGPWVGVILAVGAGALILFQPEPGTAWRLGGLVVGGAVAVAVVGWRAAGGHARSQRPSGPGPSEVSRRSWWRGWLTKRMPVVLTVLGPCVILAVVMDYPADAKWRAFAAVAVLVCASSFIGVRAELADSVDARLREVAVSGLAPLGRLESIDPGRPVLLFPAPAEKPTGLVFCLSIPAVRDQPFVLMSRSRRQDPRPAAFSSFEELREHAASRGLLAAPQTEMSDRIAADLWGRDWREP